MWEDDEGQKNEGSNTGNEDSEYPDVDIIIRLVDSDGNPIEDVSIDLSSDWGTYGERFSDSDGEAAFVVRAWRTYQLWVALRRFDKVGVSGEDETFEFTYEG